MRPLRQTLLVLLLGLAGPALAAEPSPPAAPQAASPALQREGEAKVSFTGKGPAGFKLVGTTGQLQLQDDGKALTLTVPLSTLETGIALRDRHMREKYLETGKYPDAVLVVPRGALQLPADGETKEGEAKGQLTLHGQTREVPFRYRVARRGASHDVTGTLRLNFRDFGVAVPSYLGVTVKPDIAVDVAFGARAQ